MTFLLHVRACSGHLQEGTYQRKENFGHCVLKHLGGMLFIYKLMYFYCCTAVGINVVN